MNKFTDNINFFNSFNELSDYTVGKYSHLSGLAKSDNRFNKYDFSNSYYIYSFILNPNNSYKVLDNLYCITFTLKAFNKNSKGKLLGALNKNRNKQLEIINSIHIGNGFISFYLNTDKFHSFEVGLIVDDIYNERENAFYELMQLEENIGN